LYLQHYYIIVIQNVIFVSDEPVDYGLDRRFCPVIRDRILNRKITKVCKQQKQAEQTQVPRGFKIYLLYVSYEKKKLDFMTYGLAQLRNFASFHEIK